MSTHARAVWEILRQLGEDPEREGLKDTPRRYLYALQEMTSGYGCEPAGVLKWFEDEGDEESNELILVRDIEFYSTCEHHLLPFFGKMHIGYVANGKILGLSKFARLVDIYAKRLQVQERLTRQVADALFQSLGRPLGVGVVVEARHTCMEARGVCRTGSTTTSSALRGCVLEQESCRAEFLKLAQGR